MSSPVTGKVIQGCFPHGPKLPGTKPPVIQRHANAIPIPANLLNLSARTGQPLAPPLLREMESLFNTSFGDVRIHTGHEASSIGAHAFTQGPNIYFAPGLYNPATPSGKQLLGHELTHVIQQRQGRARNPFGSGVAVLTDRMMEAEADRMGSRAATPAVVQPKMNPRFAPAPRPVLSPRPLPPPGVLQRSKSDPNPLSDFYKGLLDSSLKYKQMVGEKIDQKFQESGKYFTNTGRDLVKFKHRDEDWFHTRIKKNVFNYGVDVVADNVNLIWDVTKNYTTGVFSKVGTKTLDRLDPTNPMTLLMNPDLVKRYLSQRKTQIMQPIDFYYDPMGFAKKKSSQYVNSFYSMKDIYFGLDSHRRIKHGGNVFVDMTQQTIATAIGMWATMFTLFNLFPGARQNTKNMRDKLFPKEKLYGKFMNQFPLRLMVANPISRILGNPWLAAAAIIYTTMGSMALSLKDRKELMEKNPEIFKRLQESGTDTYRSSIYNDLIDTTKQLSDKK